MALTTAQDLATLQSWNLLNDYQRNKAAFIAVAKVVYQTLVNYGGAPPQGPIDIEQPLAAALRVTTIFHRVCAAKRHARPSLYAIFARALARYILDTEWGRIINP
jgi:hypothetical protein